MSEYNNVGRVSKCGKRFEWSIPDFPRYKRQIWLVHLSSPVFSSSGMEWKLTLTIPWQQRSHDCIEFDLLPINRHREADAIPVTFTHGIKTSDGEITDQRICTRTFYVLEDNRALSTYIDVTYTGLHTFKSRYLPSGTLTLVFHLEIGGGSVPPDGEDLTTQVPVASLSHFDSGTTEESERQTRSEHQCLTKLLDDFKDLLLNETDSDVVLKVGDKEFKAHKGIIRTRSPVLFAMFAHDTEERRTGVVNIEDCDPDTFPDFLRYVYTARVEALTEEKALHLYRISDKYQLLELKEQCVELLKRGVSIDNFCDVLSLSLQHSDGKLMEIATQFFVDNALEIVQTPRWQTFLLENPTTANELIIKGFQKGT